MVLRLLFLLRCILLVPMLLFGLLAPMEQLLEACLLLLMHLESQLPASPLLVPQALLWLQLHWPSPAR